MGKWPNLHKFDINSFRIPFDLLFPLDPFLTQSKSLHFGGLFKEEGFEDNGNSVDSESRDFSVRFKGDFDDAINLKTI